MFKYGLREVSKGFEYLPIYKILLPSAVHLEERLTVGESIS